MRARDCAPDCGGRVQHAEHSGTSPPKRQALRSATRDARRLRLKKERAGVPRMMHACSRRLTHTHTHIHPTHTPHIHTHSHTTHTHTQPRTPAAVWAAACSMRGRQVHFLLEAAAAAMHHAGDAWRLLQETERVACPACCTRLRRCHERHTSQLRRALDFQRRCLVHCMALQQRQPQPQTAGALQHLTWLNTMSALAAALAVLSSASLNAAAAPSRSPVLPRCDARAASASRTCVGGARAWHAAARERGRGTCARARELRRQTAPAGGASADAVGSCRHAGVGACKAAAAAAAADASLLPPSLRSRDQPRPQQHAPTPACASSAAKNTTASNHRAAEPPSRPGFHARLLSWRPAPPAPLRWPPASPPAWHRRRASPAPRTGARKTAPCLRHAGRALVRSCCAAAAALHRSC